jgi:outer membrane lipase/esterase
LVSGATLNLNGITAFGDSLSDTGNIALATGGTYPGPATNYAPGEFTDGPATSPATTGPTGIWLDQLAPKLGVSAPTPVSTGGLNYAFGGSEVLQGAGPGGAIPSLTQQVGMALSVGERLVSPTQLYTFWGGANDILNHPGDLTIPVAAADAIANDIRAVHDAGGRDFLWLNLPLLGFTPGREGLDPPSANKQSQIFDDEMAKDVQELIAEGIFVIPVDVKSLFESIIADSQSGCTVGPTDPFCFANVKDPAQGISGDPNTYLFWDTLHPTTAGQALIADAAFAAMQASPEPTSIALSAVGILALLLLARRRTGYQVCGN